MTSSASIKEVDPAEAGVNISGAALVSWTKKRPHHSASAVGKVHSHFEAKTHIDVGRFGPHIYFLILFELRAEQTALCS
jgi:hypothetical protein